MSFTARQKVPRRLFVTARFPISNSLIAHFDDLKKSNPNYSMEIYHDEEIESYIESNWGRFVLDLYQCIGTEYYAAKIDLWRWLIIYDKGGIYLDDKSGPVKTFDRLIKQNDEFVISTWGENKDLWRESHGHAGGEFANWCLISTPQHPLSKLVISDILCRIVNSNGKEFGKQGVLRLTGPIGSTTTILDNIKNYSRGVRIMKNSFGRKMYYNALVKTMTCSKSHHPLRSGDRDYRSQTTPILDLERVNQVVQSKGITSNDQMVDWIFSDFDSNSN